MTMRIIDKEKRVIVFTLVIDVLRIMTAAVFDGRRSAEVTTDILLGCAVLVGQAEGHPLNASKVAEFAGVSRPTAVRRLMAMVEIGVLERKGRAYLVPDKVANNPRLLATAAELRTMIIKAGVKLSTLDTQELAG